jgi:RNA polymerase sigma-70 factor (ECF subfamily)
LSGPLSEAFLSALGRDATAYPDLEAALAEIVDRARATWRDVGLDDRVFVRHLATRVGDGPLPQAFGALHLADLYLACACSLGTPAALRAFEQTCMAKIDLYIARVARSAESKDEVRQNVRQALLVGRDGHPPVIAAYTGRGPLQAWVRVSAVRAAIRLVRRARPDPLDAGAMLDLRSPENDPELELLKRRYAAELRAAFVHTLESLSPDERNVLRLHYLDGLTLEEVAATYRVSRATGARWLAQAREKILAETRRRLKEQLGVRENEIDSLVALAASRLPMSFGKYLAS